MAAPKYNSNAKKWTNSLVRRYLKEIAARARNPKELFLGQVLKKAGLYKDIWAYWLRKFADDEDLMYEMGLIKDSFEVNLYRAACDGKVPAGFAIMNLKNNYGWRENSIADKPQKIDETQVKEDKTRLTAKQKISHAA
jgi:hypothetical protein